MYGVFEFMKIEYLGEYETDLYDINVEDNHNFFGNDILVHNCDTDSIYVNMGPLIEKVFGTVDIDRKTGEEFLDKICSEKIEKVISNAYIDLFNKMKAYENAMSMKREKITDRAIFIAKKRYLLNVLNSEGVHYEKPKISVTGIESVRSSTPEICREKMIETFDVIMNETEEKLQDFISKFKEEFNTKSANDIAKNSGTDDIEKYMDKNTTYKKGCPIHVRGSILYNNYLKETKLDKKYEKIQSGDKIKFVYLKMPNPIRENVISFVGNLPEEMNLNDYIDYETQFDKVFLKPIENILQSIGWTSEKISSLDGFFT